MYILSLFDGIASARLSLHNLDIECKYYASEINQYAIKVAETNFKDIIQIGDIRNIDGSKFKNFDLLIGGSPCQDLSKAKQGGKGLEGDNSSLFYHFSRILKESNPRYFVLENVASMKDTNRDLISKELDVSPIMIDSALLTAQSRKRYYWTNIPNVTQPEDKHIYLKDIIESGEVDRDKSYAIDAHYEKGGSLKTYFDYHLRQIVKDNKYQSSRRLAVVDGETYRLLTPIECERLQGFPDNYTSCLSKTQRYNALGNSFTIPVIVHILSFME